MLIFSKKVDRDSIDNLASFLGPRGLLALSKTVDPFQQNRIYTKLIDLAKVKNDILMMGDVLIAIYPNLRPEQKIEVYHTISSLYNHPDFHLRRHAMTLLALLINKELL